MESSKRQDNAGESEGFGMLNRVTASIILIPKSQLTEGSAEDEEWMAKIVPFEFENQAQRDDKSKIVENNGNSSSDFKQSLMPLPVNRKAQFAKDFVNSVIQYKAWKAKQRASQNSNPGNPKVTQETFPGFMKSRVDDTQNASGSGEKIDQKLRKPIKRRDTEGSDAKIAKAAFQNIEKAKDGYIIPKPSAKKGMSDKNPAATSAPDPAGKKETKTASNFDSKLKQLKKTVKILQNATQMDPVIKPAKGKPAKGKSAKAKPVSTSSTIKTNKIREIAENSAPCTSSNASSGNNNGEKALFTSTAEEVVKFRKRQNSVPFQIVPAKPKKRRSTNASSEARNNPPEGANELAEGYWPVDKILKRRKVRDTLGTRREYLVRWIGNWADSWEPESFLTPETVQEFKTKSRIKRHQREIAKMVSRESKVGHGDGEPGVVPFSKHYDSKVYKVVRKAYLPKLVDQRALDGRVSVGPNGFELGLKILHIEQFKFEEEECALVRFQGHSLEEIYTIEQVLEYQSKNQQKNDGTGTAA